MGYDAILCMNVRESKKTGDRDPLSKAIRACDDLKSDKEKALREYEAAKKKWREMTKGVTLRELRQLKHSKEYLDFVKSWNKCKNLGCKVEFGE